MKSRLYIVFIIIILFLISFLQSDFFYWLRIFNARPDFLLIICGLLGFYTVGKYSTSFLCSVFAGVSAGAFSSCPVFLFVFMLFVPAFSRLPSPAVFAFSAPLPLYERRKKRYTFNLRKLEVYYALYSYC